MTRTYTTLDDLVDQEIAPAFGEYGNDYDLDGFVRALRDADVIIYVQHGFQLVTDDDGQTPGFWELAATFDTSTAPDFAACELTTRTTFTRTGYSTVTLGAGCVVVWTPGTVPGTIDVEHFGHTATISQDDAIPMEWDAQDQMWVRA